MSYLATPKGKNLTLPASKLKTPAPVKTKSSIIRNEVFQLGKLTRYQEVLERKRKIKQSTSPVAALIRSIKSDSISRSNKSHMSGSESHQVSILNQHHRPNIMVPGAIVSAAAFETQGNEENDLRAGSKDGIKYQSFVNSSPPSDSGENSSTH